MPRTDRPRETVAMTALESPPFDPARAQSFAGRMVDVLNDGSLALLCHLGHQLGLFDTMAELGPTTIQQLADAEVNGRASCTPCR
jgi:hypothetical protein